MPYGFCREIVSDVFVDLQVRTVSAKYIMKCDDDTFVRVDAVIKEAKKVPSDRSLYVGNMNYFHKPLRYGKWAVTYEVYLTWHSAFLEELEKICLFFIFFHDVFFLNFQFSDFKLISLIYYSLCTVLF